MIEFRFTNATLQSLTGKYRGLQGNPCNENRDPVMRTGVPCNENRYFPVGIDSQGVFCELYKVWVYSAMKGEIQYERFYSLTSTNTDSPYCNNSMEASVWTKSFYCTVPTILCNYPIYSILDLGMPAFTCTSHVLRT